MSNVRRLIQIDGLPIYMQEIDSDMPIDWLITQKPLAQRELHDWKALMGQSVNVTSTNSINYNLYGLTLIKNLEPIYVLGYFRTKGQNQLENKALKVAFILVRKQRSIIGISFSLLQPISHDHVDMMSILGVEYLNNTNILTSLITALNSHVNKWHMLSARRLRNIKPLNHPLISPTYQRNSAYFSLRNDGVRDHDKIDIKNIIPKKLYKNILRFERKIEKEQQATLKLLSHTQRESINSALGLFFKLEAHGWKGKAGSAIQSNETLETFYKNSWNTFADDGIAKIYCLYCGDDLIASGIAIQTNDEIILHKIAFNEALSQFGPGSILVKHIIQNSIDEELVKSICFNTNPPWLSRWHPKLYNLVALQIFNTNLKSQFIRFLFKLADTLRIIKRRIKTK